MDITLCRPQDCPLKETCVRYDGQPNLYNQSYFIESPYKDGKCEYYWGIKNDTPLTEKDEMQRFYDNINDQLCDINYLYDQYAKFGISVKLNEFDILRYGLDHGVNIVCVDVANGYLESVLNYVSFLRDIITKLNYSTLIMAGNVVTLKGANNLWNAGADLVRVGIGSGGLCTTRNITGVGYPQLSALFEVSGYEGIVSDGGIRNSGDIVKALAAGADFVMIGSLLGKAKESANNGIIYGMASRKLQEEYYQAVKSVEGIEKSLEKTTTVKELIDELSYGIRSACTYLNCSEVSKLHQSVSWVETGRGTLKEL
jgi:IMP dehydrogenase/GMP reductase